MRDIRKVCIKAFIFSNPIIFVAIHCYGVIVYNRQWGNVSQAVQQYGIMPMRLSGIVVPIYVMAGMLSLYSISLIGLYHFALKISKIGFPDKYRLFSFIFYAIPTLFIIGIVGKAYNNLYKIAHYERYYISYYGVPYIQWLYLSIGIAIPMLISSAVLMTNDESSSLNKGVESALVTCCAAFICMTTDSVSYAYIGSVFIVYASILASNRCNKLNAIESYAVDSPHIGT